MIRTLRLALVAVAVVAIAGLAYAGPNCDKTAANSSCGAKTTAVKAGAASADCAAACAAAGKTCTAAQQAACAGKAKMADAGCAAKGEAAMADCSYCNLIHDLHANAGKVKLSAEETDNGVVVVFAAVSRDDVAQAHAVAAKAYDMMSKPAACAVTKAKMASSACDGCKKGLEAFANSKVTMQETADGDKAMVSADDEQTIEQLHAFFRNLQAHAAQG